MNLLSKFSVILTGMLLSFNISFAFEVPEFSNYVTDNANIFSSEEEASLLSQINKIKQTTTAEIAVLTVKSTDNIAISDYATKVGQTWGVGKDDKDNGVMVVIAIDDREWFIATGYGVEGILPDLRTKQIAEKNFPKNFRVGNYYAGINTAVRDIGKFLAQDESIISKYNSAQKQSTKKRNPLELSMILLFAGLFIGNIWSKRKKKRAAIVAGIIAILVIFLMWGPTIEEIIKSIAFGIGTFLFTFVSLVSKGKGGSFIGGGRDGSRGGGSGFGGFGGGSFGGGGSGGRW